MILASYSDDVPEGAGPIALRRPAAASTPFVFASPHSGRGYHACFLEQTPVGLAALRRSEDAYVDQLFACVPEFGAPLLAATFPRVFVDPNRAPDELDPDMFDPPAAIAGPVSSRAAAGLGLVPRLGADGRALYGRTLPLAEARRRIESCYAPYHAALRGLIDESLAAFGEAVVIDCHSMPSASARGADVVLGDRYGVSCSRGLVARAEAHFRDLGFAVVRNRPYAGGYTTEYYGRPARGVQALQIEINRGLYLDEARVRRSSGFNPLARAIADWTGRMIEEAAGGQVAAE
ncbi:MAG: N-formylglutamate amidohydrolase [Oceanicaulis sp.]